jgi:hypothetical protein
MTGSSATPATSESSTLYFGPWYRRSIPFIDPRKDIPKS